MNQYTEKQQKDAIKTATDMVQHAKAESGPSNPADLEARLIGLIARILLLKKSAEDKVQELRGRMGPAGRDGW